MNVVIIEDEKPAAARLGRIISKVRPEAMITATLDSVKQAVQWFRSDDTDADLVFMDIQLADGLSFEIFEQVQIPCPVIFTTAYDEYALRAFKVNSIDYLLKPIDAENLEHAFSKLESLRAGTSSVAPGLDKISSVMDMLTSSYKKRFLVKTGEHIRSIPVEEIQYFFSRQKATFCCTEENKNYLLDHSLEQVESMVDPEVFFRVNRKYLVSMDAIEDIISYSSSRLKIILKNCDDKDVIVSRDRVNDFKAWLDR